MDLDLHEVLALAALVAGAIIGAVVAVVKGRGK
jgi:uncharacterized membrane-anchored protein YhcB (DUF1043 family)